MLSFGPITLGTENRFPSPLPPPRESELRGRSPGGEGVLSFERGAGPKAPPLSQSLFPPPASQNSGRRSSVQGEGQGGGVAAAKEGRRGNGLQFGVAASALRPASNAAMANSITSPPGSRGLNCSGAKLGRRSGLQGGGGSFSKMAGGLAPAIFEFPPSPCREDGRVKSLFRQGEGRDGGESELWDATDREAETCNPHLLGSR